jgi:hypothetical protein
MTERQWTLVISIGRRDNVNGLDLTDQEWLSFRGDVHAALVSRDVQLFFAGTGWGEYEGVVEESATWIGATRLRPDPVLEHTFEELAGQYDQDSIAVTYGETVLVGPRGQRMEV